MYSLKELFQIEHGSLLLASAQIVAVLVIFGLVLWCGLVAAKLEKV